MKVYLINSSDDSDDPDFEEDNFRGEIDILLGKERALKERVFEFSEKLSKVLDCEKAAIVLKANLDDFSTDAYCLYDPVSYDAGIDSVWCFSSKQLATAAYEKQYNIVFG
jgi:hypothetical protein